MLLHERAAAGQSMDDLAGALTMDDIAQHLYTAGLPDPDLVIRTSGEQRMSNFLLWQSAYLGAVLLRRVLAGVPRDRLPAGAAQLRGPRPPLRRLTVP